MVEELRCYRREDGLRAIVGGHDPAPGRPSHPEGCRGCTPCAQDHCGSCGYRHTESAAVCPRCLALVRLSLKIIVGLYGHLLDEAMMGQQATRELPGGDATVALGPWSRGSGDITDKRWAEWRAYTEHNQQADDWHPLSSLEMWGEMWREWCGQPEPEAEATMTSAAGYLGRHLAEINAASQRTDSAGDGDLEYPPDFMELAADIGAVRARLENVLHDGERQQSGAPCLRCNTNLIRVVDSKGRLTDDWSCPKCRRSYDPLQYANAVRAGYAVVQVECVEDVWGGKSTWGTVARAAIAAKRSERTIRTWMRDGAIRRACLLAGRRQVVSVDDALRENMDRQRRLATSRKSA